MIIPFKRDLIFQLLMTVYPEFIAPLFDKYVPLPESELKQKIEKLAESLNFPLKKLLVVFGKVIEKIRNFCLFFFKFFIQKKFSNVKIY